MRFFRIPEQGKVLDIGCGGGFFIASMLRRAPEAHFCGVDYSPVSVKKTLAFNRRAVRTGQVEAVEGSVSNLPFAEASFDLATASETIYFWPDPANDVREVFRVLRPGGTFAVCCDSSNPETAKKYTERIHGMKVYTPAELCAFLFCRTARRNLGGMSGDISGFSITLSELAGLLLLVCGQGAVWS